MKKHKHQRLFEVSLAVLALGTSGLLVYQNTGGPSTPATTFVGKSRSNLRNLAAHTPETSKAQAPATAPEALPIEAKPHLFQEFNDWAIQYSRATPTEQHQMLAKGETMVKERHERMAGLIEKSPQIALVESDALSPLAREALPEELKTQLEQPVNARADLDVIAAYGKDVTPYRRTATLDGQEYTVYPAGNNESLLCEKNRSLLGIKLAVNRTTTFEGKTYPLKEKIIALRGSRVRVLSTEEVAVASKRLKKGAEPTCEVSTKSVTVNQTPAAIETGGDIKWLCAPSHATSWLGSPDGIAAAGLPPGVAAAGDVNSGAGGFWPLANGWSTGYKQYLCVRFLCQDQTTTAFPDAAAAVNTMLTQISRWSYQRVTFGYSVPETMIKLPHTSVEYKNKANNLDAWADARALINANFVTSDYAFFASCIQGVYDGDANGVGAVGGYGYMGGTHTMVALPAMQYLQHELGHNLGLPHLNTYIATTADPIGAGYHKEYAGSYDVMADLFGSFNTMSRFYLRWLNASEIHDLGFRTEGTYDVYDPDVSAPVTGRKYCISIPRSDGSFYFVEFRPNIRTFADGGTVIPEVLNGLRILRTKESQQVDMKPLSTAFRDYQRPYDGTLLAGQEFYDAAEGVRIKAISKNSSGTDQYFKVQVSYTNSSVISGHNYMIRAKGGNFVVGVTNNSLANGGQIAQQTQDGNPNQKWMLMETALNSGVYRIVNMNSGKILEVGGNSKVNGGKIQQWDYVGTPSQKWRIIVTSASYFKLINVGSGLALTVPSPVTQTGIQLQQYTYQNGVNQQWAFDEVSPLISGVNYRMTARHSGKAMDVPSYEDIAPIHQWTVVSDSPFQKWKCTSQGGAMNSLINVATSKALQVGGTSNLPYAPKKYGMLDGDQITQKTITGDAWQKWTLVAVDSDAGGFWYKLINVGSGIAADVTDASTSNGMAILQHTYVGGQHQQWRFTRLP